MQNQLMISVADISIVNGTCRKLLKCSNCENLEQTMKYYRIANLKILQKGDMLRSIVVSEKEE